MRKQLKLLTLAIACALLYACKKDPDPEIKTTISVEVVDKTTNMPAPDIPFTILADYTNNLFNSIFDTIDSVSTNADGKFKIVLSSNKIGKPRSFAVRSFPSNTKLFPKYYNLQCTSSIDLCTIVYPGESKTLTFSAY